MVVLEEPHMIAASVCMTAPAFLHTRRGAWLVVAALLSVGSVATAQTDDPGARFTHTTIMIPMRDGVRLNTEIYAPKDQSGPLPIMFRRPPYGVAGAANGFTTAYKEL